MYRRVTYLSEIVSGRVDWKIRVKVIRLWNGTDFVDRSIKNTIEMVLVDEKGTRMQCNIKKVLMASFENVFTEGSGYLIQNIMVAHNDGRFKISPHRKNQPGCTLWNDYAEEVESYLSNVGIFSYYETSKMMLNAEVKEVEDYRSRLEASEVSITQVLSQPSTDTFLSKSDDLMQTKRVAIAEIVESSEVKDIGGKWFCEGKNWSTNFVVFDKVGLKLFGKSVGEMNKSKQIGFDDELPPEIDMLVDKVFVFKVEGDGGHSKFKQTFNIKYMTDDIEVVEKFRKKHFIEDFVEYENERNSEMADNNADNCSSVNLVHNCDGSVQIAENLKDLSQVNIAETPTSKQVSKRSHESADLISIVDDDGSQTSSSKIPKLGDLNEAVMKLKDVKKEPTD
ncbi:Nucleic acid-binding, OB-fold [Sesbania bispinosa]|nr:Nucleic acid-binding, OB-fold [Sesbania bispinosa]